MRACFFAARTLGPLSLKALQEDPLIRFADQVGRVLTGPITKVVPFGVFVQLAPDVVGFLHLSELTDEPIETQSQLDPRWPSPPASAGTREPMAHWLSEGEVSVRRSCSQRSLRCAHTLWYSSKIGWSRS
ncbi:S1 RNA-binding domain-containing protein [Kitasatospora sp. GAS204B]|uniref:S1 RNA-binding domain-containing protein n=1 Tax=unclassified Kitasatospora TaxID=2633591 RepID=UPI0024738192|nr:S1 RNA-binding domain-containing protein [Kitasatospora sp. GAS204B]